MPVIDLDILKKFFMSQPVSKAWLFGSYARGEQTDESDVDILVNFDDSVGLFQHAHILVELEDLLSRPVDLVPDDCLYPELRPYVDADKILIYERID